MIVDDKFLTNILKKKTGNLNFSKTLSLEEFKKYEFIYAKTNINNININKAKKFNFYLITTSVLLQCNYKHKVIYPEDKRVIFAEKNHMQQIEDIAYNSFKYDRFHKDPNISNPLASTIKKKWISNFFLNQRGDQCFIFLNKNDIEGFLLTIKKKNKVFIDLITVKETARGKGIAKKLINKMFNYYNKKNLEFLVGTQINNIASIKLYQSLGFKFIDYALVWHYFKK